ncbi:Uncharacterised protein [Klebsiella pneumoniae]|nr:Uncharacterised protein [Klebsiella pneumoniae]
MKVTEPGLNKLIDNLNTLICEDSLLTRQERETLVLAVELTEAGRGIAEPLFQAEREAETARQRLTDVRRLPLRQTAAGDAVELQLDDGHYTIREAAYVIRLDGTTCLQLTDAGGIRRIKEGDPLQVASWYQTCFDAGLPVTVQVNESRD